MPTLFGYCFTAREKVVIYLDLLSETGFGLTLNNSKIAVKGIKYLFKICHSTFKRTVYVL